MKKLLNSILLVSMATTLLTCKKYDEGGLKRLTNKHLCGGNKIGDKKTWKLKLYEVDGIDSTNLIKNSNVSDFYDVTFELTSGKRDNTMIIWTQFSNFELNIGITSCQFSLIYLDHTFPTAEDSLQCNNQYCYRNIFIPTVNTNFNKVWRLKKLTSKELIIEKVINSSYRIKLVEK